MPLSETTSEFGDISQTAKEIFYFLISPELQEKLFPLKIIFIFFLFLFLFITVFLLLRTTWFGWWKWKWLVDFLFPRAFSGKEKTRRRKWEKIKKGIKSDIEAQRKLSFIKAHSLLEAALKRAGHTGESLLERLNNLDEAQISNLAELKETEKMCQNILNDSDYYLSKERAEKVIEVLEKTFEELELL